MAKKKDESLEKTVDENGDVYFTKPPDEEPILDPKDIVQENGVDEPPKELIRDDVRQKMVEDGNVIPMKRREVYMDMESSIDAVNKKIRMRKQLDEEKVKKLDISTPKEFVSDRGSADKAILDLRRYDKMGENLYVPDSDRKIVQDKFDELVKFRNKHAENFPKVKAGGKDFFKKIYNKGKYGAYSLIPGMGAISNSRTKKYVAENPGKHKLVFIKKGKETTSSTKFPLAEQMRDEGYLPIITKKLSTDEIDGHLSDMGKEAKDFDDIILYGFSTGAHDAKERAIDGDIRKFGTDKVYMVAPMLGGNSKNNLYQKMANPFHPAGNTKKHETQKKLLHLNQKAADGVNTYVISGLSDRLATVDSAIDPVGDPHGRKHYIITNPTADHIGLSGVDRDVNRHIIDIINQHSKKDLKKRHGHAPKDYHSYNKDKVKYA